MFLEVLQALGAFLGGLGAFLAGAAQLLALLRKRGEETEGAGHGGDRPGSWMIPAWLGSYSAAAA